MRRREGRRDGAPKKEAVHKSSLTKGEKERRENIGRGEKEESSSDFVAKAKQLLFSFLAPQWEDI